MEVICNATPLINFAAIKRLYILKDIFTNVIIPEAVYRETTQASFPSSEFILQAIAEEWLQLETITSIPNSLSSLLDREEREAIALAIFKGETRVLLDERQARKIAQSLNLEVMGTLGILVLANKSQVIARVKPLLDGMRKDAQYWVSDSLARQILERVEE